MLYTVEDIVYPEMYPELDELKKKKIIAHCNRYGIYPRYALITTTGKISVQIGATKLDIREQRLEKNYTVVMVSFMIFKGWGYNKVCIIT